jgi:hypothetical protein
MTPCPSTPDRAVLVGAFGGLRSADACSLRVYDVEFTRGICPPPFNTQPSPSKRIRLAGPCLCLRASALELSATWPGTAARPCS